MAYGIRILCRLGIALLLAGCVSDSRYNLAISKIDAHWKVINDKTLATDGKRIVGVSQYEAFVAVQRTAQRLGMLIEDQDRATGFVFATGTAPTPLTQDEWKQVQKSDTKEMREVLSGVIGPLSWFKDLDPMGKDVLANVLIVEVDKGVEISIGIKLRSTRKSGDRDRRLQPPPTAMRIGTKKFWRIFSEEILVATGQGKVSIVEAENDPPENPADQPPDPPESPGIQAPDPPAVDDRNYGLSNPDAVAVIVGNRDYQGEIPDVSFAHNDADEMRRFIIYDLGYRESNVVDLRDATLLDMQRVFGNEKSHEGQLWRWVRPRESDVVVYYSGHGVPGRLDKRQYLLPVQSNPKSPEIDGYALETLYRNLSQLDARSVAVYLDTCFSGNSQGGPLLKGSGIKIVPPTETQLTVVTAATAEQIASWDEEARQGMFTRFLLQGLKGAADSKRYGRADGRITVKEIKNYLDREMTYAAKRQNGLKQNATVRGNPEVVLVELP